jgi:hypothetical protein
MSAIWSLSGESGPDADIARIPVLTITDISCQWPATQSVRRNNIAFLWVSCKTHADELPAAADILAFEQCAEEICRR